MSTRKIHPLPGDPFGWGATPMQDRIAVVDTSQAGADYRTPHVGYSRRQWRDYPPVHTFLPLRYRSGGMWRELEFGCGDCKAAKRGQVTYGGDEVRGHIGRMVFEVDGDIRECFAVEAALLCPVCDTFTFKTCLLPDTMQLVCLETNADGKRVWATYGEPSAPPNLWRRVRNWLRNLFTRDEIVKQLRAKQDLPRE